MGQKGRHLTKGVMAQAVAKVAALVAHKTGSVHGLGGAAVHFAHGLAGFENL
jgi:hypothetical protein